MAFKRSCKCDLIVYLQAYFVTIATILGTGILGLPVTLSHSGLYPFFVSFIIDALIQSLLVCFFVDLLQRAIAAQQQYQGEESLPLNAMLEEDITLVSDDDDDDFGSSNGAIMKGKMLHIREVPTVQPPNLHLLGKLFLSCGLAGAFDFIIIIQFIALLICYALAGSEAFAQIAGVDHFYVIPAFVWTLTLAIVFALQCIKPVVSILTFVKGTLLLGTAVVTFYVGLTVAQAISNDFSYIAAPFLMGTVALGGVINTMPYTFEKITYKRMQIFKYHVSVQVGLWTCVFLNIVWCWTVLEIVPQTVAMECMSDQAKLLSPNSTAGSDLVRACSGELNLESAAARGEISTIPLTRLLERDHPHFTWVALLVQVFILVSITVSYLTIGTAMHHTLNGIVQSFLVKKKRASFDKAKVNRQSTVEWCFRAGVSLVAFSLVFIVAMVDPQGFVEILEKLVSFTLNIEVGTFVFFMLVVSRRGPYRNLEIPLPMQGWVSYLMLLIPLFFNFACLYDIYNTVTALAYPGSHPSTSNNSTFLPQTPEATSANIFITPNTTASRHLINSTEIPA